MTIYYKYVINKKALPYQFQILRLGYRRADRTGFHNAVAIISIGWSRPKRKLVFNIRRPF